jgi:phosphotransferase system IIA component
VIHSPADGIIESVSDSRHAYAISTEIGDLLVHIGIDSVRVPEAFEPLVKKGDSVSAGQPIARADLEKLRTAGINTIIPVLITDKRAAGEVKIKRGPVRGGQDVALIIEK